MELLINVFNIFMLNRMDNKFETLNIMYARKNERNAITLEQFSEKVVQSRP